MSAEENKAIVRRLIEAGNEGNLSVLDELIDHNHIVHPLWPNPVLPPNIDATTSGPERAKAFEQWFTRVFSDLRVTIDEMLAAGDKVVTRATTHATSPDGTRLMWQGITIDRIANGKVVESWFLWDRLGLFQQLGLVPETTELLTKAGF